MKYSLTLLAALVGTLVLTDATTMAQCPSSGGYYSSYPAARSYHGTRFQSFYYPPKLVVHAALLVRFPCVFVSSDRDLSVAGRRRVRVSGMPNSIRNWRRRAARNNAGRSAIRNSRHATCGTDRSATNRYTTDSTPRRRSGT